MLKKRGFLKLTAGLCLIMVVLVGGIRVISGATSPVQGNACLQWINVNGTSLPVYSTVMNLQDGSQIQLPLQNPSLDTEPDVTTPDGQSVAHWGTDHENHYYFEIYLHGRLTPGFVRAAAELPYYDQWSPDGRKLAYVWNDTQLLAKQEIYNYLGIFDVDSGTEQILDLGKTDNFLSPDWSPDSKTIGFIVNKGRNKQFELWSGTGPQPKQAVPLPNMISVTWQSSQRLAYVRQDNDNNFWIGTVSLDAPQNPVEHQVTANLSLFAGNYYWSADNQYVMVVLGLTGDSNYVYILGIDGTLSPLIQDVVSEDWSKDGHSAILKQSQADGTKALMLYKPDGPNGQPQTQTIPIQESETQTASWSSNKNHLAVSWTDALGMTHLNVIDLDTQRQVSLENDTRQIVDTYWVGDYLVVVVQAADQSINILWSKSDGSDLREMTSIDGQKLFGPIISPYNSQMIIVPGYSNDESKFADYLVDLDTRQTKSLFSPIDQSYFDGAAWSPDNRRFVLQEDYTGYVFNMAGDKLAQIENISPEPRGISWIPCD